MHIRKLLTSLLLALLLFSNTVTVLAQNQENLTPIKESANEIFFVKVNIPTPIIAQRPAVFSVSPQFDTTQIKSVEYFWDFGDGDKDIGEEVVHTYDTPGNYTVSVETKITQPNENVITTTETLQIFASQQFAILISDRPELEDKIDKFIRLAKDDNITLQLVESYDSQSAFLSEEILSKKLIELNDVIQKTDAILIWSQSGTGLNAITRYLQDKEGANLQNKTIISFVDEINNLQRIERQFHQIGAREIIVVREPGIGINYLESENIEEYKNSLAKGGYDFEVIDEKSSDIKPWLALSYSLNFLTEKGIPDNILLLILLLPVIATVIAFLKQVVGVTTLGLYTPAIITLTLLVLGIKFGVIALTFITFVSIVTHKILKKLRLLYIPKMAIVITIVSLTIFILFSLALLLGLVDANFISLAIFPTVIMGTLVEKVITANTSNSIIKPVITLSEVLFVSIIAYIIVGGPIDLFFFNFQFHWIQNLISNYPESIILTVVFDTLLGRWTGLRLTEYMQFREILYNTEE